MLSFSVARPWAPRVDEYAYLVTEMPGGAPAFRHVQIREVSEGRVVYRTTGGAVGWEADAPASMFVPNTAVRPVRRNGRRVIEWNEGGDPRRPATAS